MGEIIASIIADTQGGKLWIRDVRVEDNRLFFKYRTSYNDIPFTDTEGYIVDGGQNVVITGADGTILWRFSVNWLALWGVEFKPEQLGK